MTAHGLSEQNHHRWVGVMDDCLAKPIRLRDLANVLERWVGFSAHAMVHPSSSSEASLQIDQTVENAINHLDAVRTPDDHQKSCYPYDILAALESIDGDEALLHSLFQIFLDTGPNLIHGMREAIATEDRLRLHREAHQLKGALSALNGPHQAKMVERLEAEASISPFPQLRHLLEEIEHEVKTLMSVFRSAIQAWGKRWPLMQRKAKSEESGVSSE
jgi:HPt (histidine-containing phosphotransfer) domain-containing protein